MYNALNSDLASQGYTVLALDHTVEAPYLQLPDGREGVYGIDIRAVWNRTLQEAVYRMWDPDILATARDLHQPLVESFNAPFDTTHYISIGNSLDGAAAAGALAVEDSIIGGVNPDGLFVELSDVKKPFLMLAGAEHMPELDVSWSPFSGNQSGWRQWLSVTGSSHQDFSDSGDWVDLQCLSNRTLAPSLGTIWGPRMYYIVRNFVETFFFGFVAGKAHLLDVPSPHFSEVVYINGSLVAVGTNLWRLS